MQLSQAFLGLPAQLLLLVATQLQAQQLPTAIRKMSLDEGEKIMPEHLAFAPELYPWQSPIHARALLTPEEELRLGANSSATLSYRPPFGIIHGSGSSREVRDIGPLWRRAKEALHRLRGRDFSCPTNTQSCDSIGQSNYCCATGETCFVVEDQPDAGNVGCCPQGQNCGGSVGACGADTTACDAEVGGGCCIAGFVCAQVGCIASTVTAITMTSTSTSVATGPSASTVVTTVVVTVSPSIQTTVSTATSTTTVPTSTATQTTATTTTTGGQPPFRPTSGTDTTTAAATTNTVDYCPTGFYACLATAGSGCCRTGRDCVTTSCPPVSSTTITSNGITLVVPASDVPTTTATSTCATGWFLCGSDAGAVAGCCPSGYACGTASCTLSAATATATVQKELPNKASSERREPLAIVFGMVGLGLLLGIMI